MKFRLSLVAVLTLFLIGAKGSNMMTVTLVNKAGMEIAVSLIANDLSSALYFTVPKGDHKNPYETKFTLVKDSYRMRVFYLEERDPTTGMRCRTQRTSRLMAYRNMRIVVTGCDVLPEARGEPTIYKFGRWSCMY